MRILHVNKFLYRRGGAEGYMLDVAALQRAAGHDVELFGMQHPENVPDLALADTFPSHVELEPPPGGVAAVSTAARMLWSRTSARGLSEAIRRFRPDVVHCHNIYHQLSPSILKAAQQAGVRCVMTLHDYKLACPSYQLLDHGTLCERCVTGSALNAALRRCKSGSLGASSLLALESSIHRLTSAYAPVDVFISPSRFLADVMSRSGLERERLVVLNHFVEPMSVGHAGAQGPAAAGATARRTGFVFAGRLSPEKGVDTAIRAVALLSDDVHLHVAGDGPARAELEALAGRLAPGRVTFHGRLDKVELGRLVASSTATVVPSRWHENQPMTILESYAAEVPTVVTNLGGMPELVRDGVDGLVVPHDDPQAFAAALRTLHDAPDLALRMGRAGSARLRDEFDPALHLRRLEAIYRGELASGQVRRLEESA